MKKIVHAKKTDYKGAIKAIVAVHPDGDVALMFGGVNDSDPSVIVIIDPEAAEDFARNILAAIEASKVSIQ